MHACDHPRNLANQSEQSCSTQNDSSYVFATALTAASTCSINAELSNLSVLTFCDAYSKSCSCCCVQIIWVHQLWY